MTRGRLKYGLGALCAMAVLSHDALGQPAREVGSMASNGAADRPTMYAADYMRRAASFLKQGQWQQAVDDYARVLKIDPRYTPALVGQAWAYLGMRDMAAARKAADKALSISPDDPAVLKASAAVKDRMGDAAGALSALDKGIAANPNDANFLGMRATTKYLAGDFDGALRDLDQATKAAPKMVAPYLERYQIMLRRGDVAKATAEGDALLAAAPDDPGAIGGAATMFANTGRVDDAVRAFDRGIAMKPDDPEVWLGRSYIWPEDRQGRAIADAEKALALKPDAPNALLRLAGLRRDAGDHPGALELYRKLETQIREGRPGFVASALPNIQAEIAGTYARMGNEEEAVRLLAEARAGAGRDAGVLNTLCYAAATANFALEQALADCRASLALSDRPATQDSLGFVLLRMGRPDEAIVAYEGGLAPDRLRDRPVPTEAHLLYGRGLARIARGRRAEGEADIAHARTLLRTIDAEFRRYGMLPRP